MKQFRMVIPVIFRITGIGFFCALLLFQDTGRTVPRLKRIRMRDHILSVETKRARQEYFHRMLRDPATGEIPPAIRQREMAFARTLPKKIPGMAKSTLDVAFNWYEVGPNDVGGRTRALAVDVTNRNRIIAGGVSGGIWKSTDSGQTWALKNDPSQHLSITSVAQDPRQGHTNNWYYASGEVRGNSASDRGFRAYYYGTGIYKSTDNGETWNPVYQGGSPVSWDFPMDYVAKILVQPVTGSLYAAANGFGIYRSKNGGSSFDLVLGGWGQHRYADVDVSPQGDLVATISQNSAGSSSQDNAPGIYRSTDDGTTWNPVTPETFPQNHQRTVVAIAPSNPNVVYTYTFTGDMNGDREVVKFFKINPAAGTSEDRSANLPDVHSYNGYINTQNNYNMVVSVKPDDENFVILGAQSLFRSRDGFATPASTFDNWIGGYFPGPAYRYPNLHPDQHVIAFDPTDPKKVWCGHDGGLSYTTDIGQQATDKTVLSWSDMNKRYHTTQFYTVAMPSASGDNTMMGGTQDNGTPYFGWDGSETTASIDISSGDGGYAYFMPLFAFVASQEGSVYRCAYTGGRPVGAWTNVKPAGSTDHLFVTPYVVDPVEDEVMYYAAGGSLWRNNAISTIPLYRDSTDVGWTKLSALDVPSGYIISAVEVTRSNPIHTLYYAASSGSQPPRVYKLASSKTATTGAEEITPIVSQISETNGNGAYVHDIAVNPQSGNELIVVMSNYNITGLFRSTDGGESYAAVEGNLVGTQFNPGPSLRSAAILPTAQGTVYFVATSIGLFSTMQMNGSQTVWEQESSEGIGNAVCEQVIARTSDRRVLVGTHGRGIFAGVPKTAVETPDAPPAAFELSQNYPNPFNPNTTIAFRLPEASGVSVRVYDAAGRLVRDLLREERPAGVHRVSWDGTDASGDPAASGVYLYRMEAGAFSETRRCVLAR